MSTWKISLPCNHPRWSDVGEDGFQYCEVCNKARHVAKECSHQWFEKQNFVESNHFTGNKTAFCYLYQCRKCGETKIVKLGVGTEYSKS